MPDVRELPPQAGLKYVAHCDPSGGSLDSMALGISYAAQRDEDDASEGSRPGASVGTGRCVRGIINRWRTQ